MSPFDSIPPAANQSDNSSRAPRPFSTLVEAARPLVSARKFTELKSAANLLCKAASRDADTWMVSNVKDVIDAMHAVHPLQAGVNPSYWKTSCSKVTQILKLNDFRLLSGHCKTELPPEWADLVEPARDLNDKRVRSLHGFFRWCVENGAKRIDVTQSTYDAYCMDVDGSSQRKNKLGTKQAVRRDWNYFADRVPGWPSVRFSLPDKRDIYLLPDKEMPSAVAEFDAMASVPFRGQRKYRKRRRLSKATVRSRHYLFRRIISAAIKGGIAKDRLQTMADVCDRLVLETAYNYILDRQGPDVDGTCDVSRMAGLMFAVAEQWVGVTGDELVAQRELMEDFECIQQGMAEKNKRLLARFCSDKVIAEFLKTPARVMERYRGVSNLTEYDCVQMQLAAAMAILIRVLIRMENLKQVVIGKHLIEVGWGEDRRVLLVFGEDEVKNTEYLETLLSPRAVEVVDEYRNRARSKLCRGKESNCLFPRYSGKHKSASTFGKQLADFVFRETGIRVTPHQFRHLGGFFHLLRYPSDYASVQKMLGHRKLETTIKFYTGTMNRRAAFDKYNNHIDERLDEAEVADAAAAKIRMKSNAA